jgi:MoxR-like ATPase
LPQPFFVIATQNPVTQAGTFPLPESQLDRFLMRISLGYPDPASERRLLTGTDPRERLRDIAASANPGQLAEMQADVSRIQVSDSLVDYLQRLVQHTRTSGVFAYGVSPRGAMAALQAARAWAFIDGRRYVIPEDIQAVFAAVVGHRVLGGAGIEQGPVLVQQVLRAVDIL